MAKVRVWNDNKHPYKEEFRGNKISIEPGKFVLMEDDDAVVFKGTYAPFVRDANDQPDPRFFKMIRIESISGETPTAKTPEHKCAVCAYKASSEKDLEEHTDAKHLDQLADQEEADKRRKKQKAS